jgi:2-oxoglutarate ferredoxin oxidoreductase subunit alpha
VRIAVQYMTPVILLSDGYIANGSEPWKLPSIESLKPFPVAFRADPAGFKPYARDEKLARPWVVPGTPGLEHRIGGLEKEDVSGNISYDPENHERMCHLRLAKVLGVQKTIPTPAVHGAERGDLLVVGWGSTAGAIRTAVDELLAERHKVASLHLRHVWPLPAGLDAIFSRYRSILVPELNLGQMARLLRSEFPRHNVHSYPKIQGQPFTQSEIAARIRAVLAS